ncbi:PD-(D/E)XK nuclease family protein, partial [Litorivicinus sp.]|nr:PD-(D/E)XK nuclease family protein [Litorivicinus sp.]
RLWPAHLERHFFPDIVKWITSIRETFLPPGISLSNLVLTQKRPEPQFQLPLKPGLTTEALFQSFTSLPWWNSPSELPHGSLEGQLIGFIDLVYEAENRFYILDYKTNMLGETGANYTSEIITQTMLASHYQAQAAIYGLALHRWLTQRKPGYDPNQHLGSAVYLFCRGIDGPSKGIWSAPLDANAILEIEARCLDAPTH